MKKILLTFSLAISMGLSNAQTPYLVKDIYPGNNNSSNPANLTNVNGTLFFTATDGTHGVELWKSDGTAEGTVMVKDIRGSNSSTPLELVNVNGTLFFRAYTDTNGEELWKSDGTTEGTVLVKDINSGTNGSSPGALTNINGTLVFSAVENTHGSELWKSDGTEAGTVMIKDINPGSGNSSPGYFTSLNGSFYFAANDGTHGVEFWKSDGTTDGTVMVKDFDSGTSSYPQDFTNVNGTLFFTTYITGGGFTLFNLWKSDGTTNGTAEVKSNVYSGSQYDAYGELINVNGTLFFTYSDINGSWYNELWKSDGTTTATIKIKNVSCRYLTNVNGVLYFSAYDDTHGTELWKSDGTEAGTVMVKDISPSGDGVNALTNVNGTLFFTVNDGTHGTELWALDTTLPVSLINFNASLKNSGALLTWATAAETNNSHFVIEKSLDGVTFQALTTIKGKGTSATIANYQFTDVNFTQSAYYRLTQVDANGTKNVYHDMVRFVKQLGSIGYSVYPNPASHKLNLTGNLAAIKTLAIADINGKVVKQLLPTNKIDISALPSGLHFLLITTTIGVETVKFVKE